jgi:hypothetical protein
MPKRYPVEFRRAVAERLVEPTGVYSYALERRSVHPAGTQHPIEIAVLGQLDGSLVGSHSSRRAVASRACSSRKGGQVPQ